ncbi:MAG: hypothetical protein MRZ79_27120 [Bacteroidia bacterium]|nr:hypothetical protein [Bacteroidia bacterium]
MNKLFLILSLLSFTFFTAKAEDVLPTDATVECSYDNQEAVNVFVHITAIKESKDGKRSAKISKITMANGQKAGKNILPAKLRRKGNRLQFEIQMSKKSLDRVIMPKGFILSDRISKLLGSSQKVVMSGGSTMIRKSENGNGLLQFEIQ